MFDTLYCTIQFVCGFIFYQSLRQEIVSSGCALDAIVRGRCADVASRHHCYFVIVVVIVMVNLCHWCFSMA